MAPVNNKALFLRTSSMDRKRIFDASDMTIGRISAVHVQIKTDLLTLAQIIKEQAVRPLTTEELDHTETKLGWNHWHRLQSSPAGFPVNFQVLVFFTHS